MGQDAFWLLMNRPRFAMHRAARCARKFGMSIHRHALKVSADAPIVNDGPWSPFLNDHARWASGCGIKAMPPTGGNSAVSAPTAGETLDGKASSTIYA